MDTAAYPIESFRLPFPKDFSDDDEADMRARANALCGAAEAIATLCIQSGQPLPKPTEADRLVAHTVFEDQAIAAKPLTTAAGMMLTALLNNYDMQVVQNAQQLRNFCTNNLIELASSGKAGDRIRATELLGKIKDVGLFEERTTVTIEALDTKTLQAKLREKFDRLKVIGSSSTQETA